MVGGPVLIVDRDPLFRESVGTALALHGFATRVVGTGEEALAAIQTDRPALVLLDVSVRAPDGNSLIDRIQARWPQAPVVILASSDEAEEAARTCGVVAYLRKPIALPRLLNAIAACGSGGLLGGKRRRAA